MFRLLEQTDKDNCPELKQFCPQSAFQTPKTKQIIANFVKGKSNF
jgi:hypothetical protein